MTKHQGGVVTNIALRSLGCYIEQQPNNLTKGYKGEMVKQPKRPNNLTNTFTDDKTHNTTPLDVKGLENSANQTDEFLELRQKILTTLAKKQDLWVWTGNKNDAWEVYKTFKQCYNMRQILKDEIVIEFDTTNLEIVCRAISQTGLNLLKAGYTFEYWEHGGKSPHLHIKNLAIPPLDDKGLSLFKKLFIKKYVPLEYLSHVDFNLTGVKQLIALEWAMHWKGCYGVKKLIHTFTPDEYKEATQ